MIPMKDIRKALSDLIKANFPDWLLTYNNSPDVEQDYIYIELAEKRQTVDPVYYDRDIEIDVHVIPLPDVRGNVKRSKLYEAQDTLEQIILPVFRIGDRAITVQESTSRIVDEVLHFTFHLRFADYKPEDNKDKELMQELEINLSEEG
ncbi:phage tail terminator family protein [Mitsuokella multacida]|uniref:phage tail terminator family protein n=1 Tax=Mitsuokella multacida TaxID=52226 RepID=UPI00242DECB4|nr:hypothetical protein [Mitsuokella multacida]